MKKIIILSTLLLGMGMGLSAQPTPEEQALAIRNIERAKAIIDATWETSMMGSSSNLYMADQYNTVTGWKSGASDVWPYTAAIEAHNSLLEALDAAKELVPQLYEENYEKYEKQLNQLIDNLEYYRGTYTLSSYATLNQEVSPYAVPRANRRGNANVSGILNVYDDQMWIARELIRAYQLTGNEEYLNRAVYLTDYVLDGWDCWRDANGNEYGGITWGPGYNSKHACSNGPIIQPLVWLYKIYKGKGETKKFSTRSNTNQIITENVDRAEHYLEFAKKIYDWQKANLGVAAGWYRDMMGADNTIQHNSEGYRTHVDCGGMTGEFYSYNTGTMIAGGAELYKVTGDEAYRDDFNQSVRTAIGSSNFATKIDGIDGVPMGLYEFRSDETAANGFMAWFNDVYLRACVDAAPFATLFNDENYIKLTLDSFQSCLDYAFENHNRGNLLPIHLLDGWGDEEITKGFHQFAFASEYGRMASRLLAPQDDEPNEDGNNQEEGDNGEGDNNGEEDGNNAVIEISDSPLSNNIIYNMMGQKMNCTIESLGSLPSGLYIVNGKKIFLR